MTDVDWSQLTYRTAAKLEQLTAKMSRSEIGRQAEQIAGKWKAYNDDPTAGKEYAVGRGAHTPVPTGSGITWDVHVEPKATKAPKVRKSWLQSAGPKNPPEYTSDDPYSPGGLLAIKQAERFARKCGQPGYSAGRLAQDHAALVTAREKGHFKTDDEGRWYREAPGLEPGKCWEQFTRQPRNTRPKDRDDDRADHAEPKPVYSGKRSLSEQVNMMEPGSWNVSADWTSQGQFLPGMKWSQDGTVCLICWDELPDGRRKYCSDPCAATGSAAIRRHRRKGKGGSPKTAPWRPSRPAAAGGPPAHVHRWRTKPSPKQTLSKNMRLKRPWAGEPKVWRITLRSA